MTKSYDSNTAANRLTAMKGRPFVIKEKICRFGIPYLDHALGAIFHNDLILLGAPTGVGKTQLAMMIALENAMAGRKVAYLALEASYQEAEERMLFAALSRAYFDDPDRVNADTFVSMSNWYKGRLDKSFAKYKAKVQRQLTTQTGNLQIFYKTDQFGLDEFDDMTREVVSRDTELLIIDHAHFFDMEGNENAGLKKIAMAVRTLSQTKMIPVVLVAQLRKSDKKSKELIPDISDFHGSSDLVKICTRSIIVAPGKHSEKDGKSTVETFFRVCKDRLGSNAGRYIGVHHFDIQRKSYSQKYYLAKLTNFDTDIEYLQGDFPLWASPIRP